MACATGLPGLCSTGVTHCLSGADQCVPNIMPGQLPEVCNGVDDNCNGLIDEGDPGGGTSCPTGLEGVCAAGATHCMMGYDRCEQNVQPSAEICDGLDNNCNGLVDDGLGTTTCGIGPCQATTQNCVNGRTNPCVRRARRNPEICDNVDNNCNGVVDDGPWQQPCPPPAKRLYGNMHERHVRHGSYATPVTMTPTATRRTDASASVTPFRAGLHVGVEPRLDRLGSGEHGNRQHPEGEHVDHARRRRLVRGAIPTEQRVRNAGKRYTGHHGHINR